jgi:cytochrome c biogenesis protein CcdA
VTDAGSRKDEGLGTHFNELIGLVLAYAKQETVVPIKRLGRYVAWGVGGAIFFAVGGALLTVTAVRVVQSETGAHLHGNWSWVPYLGGALVALLGVVWAVVRIVRGDRALKESRG